MQYSYVPIIAKKDFLETFESHLYPLGTGQFEQFWLFEDGALAELNF